MRKDNSSTGNNNGRSGAKPPNRHIFGSGVDPVEAGRKGGLARVQSTTAAQRAEIARNAQAAKIAKYRKRLLSITGTAIEALYDIASQKGDPARASAAKAILDRSGFGPKSSIEIEGELSHDLVLRTQLLDVDRLPLIIKLQMAACLESEWEPSPELEAKIKLELPMLQIKIESSKPGKADRLITNGSAQQGGQSIAMHGSQQSITAAVIGASNRPTGRDEADQDTDQGKD